MISDTIPIEGLTTNAVGLTDTWDVASPRRALNQVPDDAGIVGRVERVRHVEANVWQILEVSRK